MTQAEPLALDLELRLGEVHEGIWADSPERAEHVRPDSQLAGIVIGLRYGTFIRPLGDWNSTAPVKTLRFPFVFPWLSVAFRQWGLYFGAKRFYWHSRYVANGIWPDGAPGDRALTFSASIRKTRLK